MTISSRKKERERVLLERFRELSGLLPDGEPIDGNEGENPDFRFQTGADVLGVEVRQLFLPDPPGGIPLQQGEGEAWSVLQAARGLAIAAGDPPAHVTVSFANVRNLRGSDRDELAQALRCAVARAMPAPGQTVYIKNHWQGPLRPEIESVTVLRPTRDLRPLWDAAGAGFHVEDCARVLQDAIDDKARKVERYMTRCDRCWLLLAAVALEASSFLYPDEATQGRVYEFPFARAFFLNYRDGQWFELRSSRS